MSLKEKNIQSGLTVTWVGIGANIVLVIIKIYAGLLGRSQALVADGIHSLSDLFSDFVVLFGLKMGSKDADENHPFGHGRIETISAMIVGMLLILAGIGMVFKAISSLDEQNEIEPTIFTLTVAFLSILIKEAMYWYTLIIGKKLKSMVLIGNAWHHRTDALSSIAVLFGIGCVYLNPNWYLADTLASIIVIFFIIRLGAKMIWDALKEVVDTAPDREILTQMNEIASSVDGVLNTHDIRARFSSGQIISEVHIVVNPNLTVKQGHAIAKEVEHTLIDQVEDLIKVIIHVDPAEE